MKKMFRSIPCLAIALGLALAFASAAEAQDRRMSPRGEAATQVGGSFDAEGGYQGGSWVVVTYGRPILRGRDLFGSGAEYGQSFLRGAPLWRVGADQSTRFMTEADLMFGGERLPAGEYSVFAELTEDEWTLIFSNWGAKETFREENPDALWGAYGYTPDRDVLRTTMDVSTIMVSADQLSISFMDMTQEGGVFSIWWDDQVATVPFQVAR
ncbi:DUF2911 domain-containing protein [Candidatus Palauibacter sp.]|uniref:DUF2911 domain-containing protein n=1 Tax=Candidatus Palauibacter sp. TaxID=3101350 RepID=UPI003C701959